MPSKSRQTGQAGRHGGSASYRAVLTAPGAMPLVIWSLLSRLAFAMTNLSLLLYVSAASGSYAFAGGMTAVSLIGTAAGAIGQGRLIDRFGPSRPLLALTAAYGPLSLALIAMVPAQHSPNLLLACTVLAQSATQPLLAVASRAMWPRLVPADSQRQTAYSYETISTETCYLIAPAIAATLAAALWPGTPLTLACGVITTTAIGFALTPAAYQHRGGDGTVALSSRHPHAVLRRRGMPILLVAALGFGTGVGFVAVGIPAAATALGATAAAGLLLATWSVSSVLGGLTYDRRPWPSEPSLRLPMLMAAFGLLLCPVFIGGFYGLTAAMTYRAHPCSPTHRPKRPLGHARTTPPGFRGLRMDHHSHRPRQCHRPSRKRSPDRTQRTRDGVLHRRLQRSRKCSSGHRRPTQPPATPQTASHHHDLTDRVAAVNSVISRPGS